MIRAGSVDREVEEEVDNGADRCVSVLTGTFFSRGVKEL